MSSALLVVDAQRDFLSSTLGALGGYEDRVALFDAFARRARCPGRRTDVDRAARLDEYGPRGNWVEARGCMAREWRVSTWLPVLTVPLGLVGLLLALGAAMTEDPWYVRVPWMGVGAAGVATAGFGIIDRLRAVVRIERGRLEFRLATGSRKVIDLARLTCVDIRPPRFWGDRRLLLVMTLDDGSSHVFPAWAAWRDQDALVQRLRVELEQAGAPLSPQARRALGLVGE